MKSSPQFNFRTFLLPRKGSLWPISNLPILIPSKHWSISIILPFLEISFKWKHTRKHTKCWLLEAHSYCGRYYSFISFYWQTVVYFMSALNFVHPLTSWWTFELFPCFWPLWIMPVWSFVYKLCGLIFSFWGGK